MAAQIGADIAEKHFARVDADANLKRRPTLTLPLLIQFFQPFDHVERGARSKFRMIGLGNGAPQKAITQSPTNLSSVPWCWKMTDTIMFKCSFRVATTLSGGNFSEIVVNPHYWLLLAESHLTRRLFGAMLFRIAALPSPSG